MTTKKMIKKTDNETVRALTERIKLLERHSTHMSDIVFDIAHITQRLEPAEIRMARIMTRMDGEGIYTRMLYHQTKCLEGRGEGGVK